VQQDETVYRTLEEIAVAQEVADVFERCPESTSIRLDNFPKYVRRQSLKRFLAMYEIFKLGLPVKGSIIECGVFRGFGLMTWAKLSAILEPENLTRRIYGFDTFEGFPKVVREDQNLTRKPIPGALRADSRDELEQLIKLHDRDRFLGHIPKISLISGDISETVPNFLQANSHLVVSLLYLDCDLYEPTRVALREFLPRMPKGALVVFDELDNPIWPGETKALCDEIGITNLELRRVEWDPYMAFAEVSR